MLDYVHVDNVGFTISSTGISLTPRKPQVLTNIEEWTTAFNTYMLIIVQKFPNRASELLQYMETIRHAAKTHGGLGWSIMTINFVINICFGVNR
jgi:membrane protein insertase Oxa1/YidC/SpoIIIJ